MRVSIILSALAASVLATPTVIKRDDNPGGVLSPALAQLNGILANVFGSLSGINAAMTSINLMANNSPLNLPGDLYGDTSLLMQNSVLEVLRLANDVSTGNPDVQGQAGVLGASVDIVTGQVQTLLNDATGIGGLYPDMASVGQLQDAANNLLASLNQLKSS